MYQKITNPVAGADSCSAMEPETISKNGASPKSLTSKRNLMKIVWTSAFMVMVFITGHAQERQNVLFQLKDGGIIRGYYTVTSVPDDDRRIETKKSKAQTVYTGEVVNKSNKQPVSTRTASSRDNYSQNRVSTRYRNNDDDNERDDNYDDESDLHGKGKKAVNKSGNKQSVSTGTASNRDSYSQNRVSSGYRNNNDDYERNNYSHNKSNLHGKGEKAFGLNIGYGSEIKSVAIGAKFNYGLTDHIRLSPSFNYFLAKDGLSEWEINVDVHYLFNVAPKVSAYPLAGLTFTGWRFDWGDLYEGSSTTTRFGVNVGAGIGYDLTDNITLGFELKYSVVSDLDQFVPSIHLIYKF
jgi:outer membrane protein X